MNLVRTSTRLLHAPHTGHTGHTGTHPHHAHIVCVPQQRGEMRGGTCLRLAMKRRESEGLATYGWWFASGKLQVPRVSPLRVCVFVARAVAGRKHVPRVSPLCCGTRCVRGVGVFQCGQCAVHVAT
eukprot:scaffold50739_cov30-Attheya_sp.AAC.2